MSATVTPALRSTADLRPRPLLGLGNLVRKDVREWVHARRLWVVLVISTLVYVLASANARINEWALANLPAESGQTPPKAMSLAPMDNVLFAIGTQFFVLAAIFATISLIIAERDGGTLAWTVSKPVSRTSVLLSKWISATALLWLVAIVVPLAATTAIVVWLYGTPSLASIAVIGLGLIAVIALYVAVSLTAATFIPSQGGVAAIGLAVFFAPSIVAGIVPSLASVLPTSILDWTMAAALGGPTPIVTPIAWLLGLATLFAVARYRFNRAEL
jgi:ABC-type transport system involved in multi-copper enzyme maturation permease subunit